MKLTRREFLRAAGGALAGGMALSALRTAHAAGTPVVVRVESPRAMKRGRPDPDVVRAMLERGLVELTREGTPERALLRFVSPRDVVGLKVDCSGGPHLHTHRELVRAMTGLLRRAGLPRSGVVVWDRSEAQLRDCGFRLRRNPRGVRVVGAGELDRSCVLSSPSYPGVSAPAYELFTRTTSCTVNMPVLKAHPSAGVALCLKSLAFGVFRHHERARDDGADPYIAEACAHPVVRERVRLHVLDALRGSWDGGPAPGPDRVWEEKALYLGLDPVAVDALCAGVIDAKREEEGLAPRTPAAGHIRTAARLGVGCAEPSKIVLRRVTI